MNASDRESIAVLATKVDALTVSVKDLQQEMKELRSRADRWKGAFGLLLILGGGAGSFLTWLFKP